MAFRDGLTAIFKMIFSLAALIICVLPYAHASDWRYLSGGPSSYFRIDFSSISYFGKYRKVWTEANYLESNESTAKILRLYKSNRVLIFFDCLTKTSLSTQSIEYSGLEGSGEVVGSFSVKFSSNDFIDIVPDSIGDLYLYLACADQTERDRIKLGLVNFSPPIQKTESNPKKAIDFKNLSDEEITKMLMKK